MHSSDVGATRWVYLHGTGSYLHGKGLSCTIMGRAGVLCNELRGFLCPTSWKCGVAMYTRPCKLGSLRCRCRRYGLGVPSWDGLVPSWDGLVPSWDGLGRAPMSRVRGSPASWKRGLVMYTRPCKLTLGCDVDVGATRWVYLDGTGSYFHFDGVGERPSPSHDDTTSSPSHDGTRPSHPTHSHNHLHRSLSLQGCVYITTPRCQPR